MNKPANSLLSHDQTQKSPSMCCCQTWRPALAATNLAGNYSTSHRGPTITDQKDFPQKNRRKVQKKPQAVTPPLSLTEGSAWDKRRGLHPHEQPDSQVDGELQRQASTSCFGQMAPWKIQHMDNLENFYIHYCNLKEAQLKYATNTRWVLFNIKDCIIFKFTLWLQGSTIVEKQYTWLG